LIVVDTSAFVAIVAGEPDAISFARALGRAADRVMSAGNYLECGILAQSRFAGRPTLDEFLQRRAVRVVPVDLAMAQLAAEAFGRYGKGRHPASLNYGDCFAYALAKRLGAPLLYKGDDFARTDMRSALAVY
jgi:ribonuclease VapC